MATGFIALVYNGQLGKYGGDVAISSYAIVSSVMTFIIMPASGISQGIQPIVGFNYGAGNYDRVKQTFLKSTVFSVGVTSVIWIITEVFPAVLINLFGGGEELLSIGMPTLVPFIYILPRFLGTMGIFYAQPISDLLATILSAVLIVLSFRKMSTNKTNFLPCENT